MQYTAGLLLPVSALMLARCKQLRFLYSPSSAVCGVSKHRSHAYLSHQPRCSARGINQLQIGSRSSAGLSLIDNCPTGVGMASLVEVRRDEAIQGQHPSCTSFFSHRVPQHSPCSQHSRSPLSRAPVVVQTNLSQHKSLTPYNTFLIFMTNLL